MACFGGNCAGFNGNFTLQRTSNCTWVAQGVVLTQTSATTATLVFTSGNATATYVSTNWSCTGGLFTIQTTNCDDYPQTISLNFCGDASSSSG